MLDLMSLLLRGRKKREPSPSTASASSQATPVQEAKQTQVGEEDGQGSWDRSRVGNSAAKRPRTGPSESENRPRISRSRNLGEDQGDTERTEDGRKSDSSSTDDYSLPMNPASKRPKKMSAHHMQRRHDTWLAAVKSYLDSVRLDYESKHGFGAESSVESCVRSAMNAPLTPSLLQESINFPLPQTEEEINNFLRHVWRMKGSKVPKEIAGIKLYYIRKLKELTRSYADRSNKPGYLPLGSNVLEELYMTDYGNIKEHMKHFERLQFELKHLVALTIIAIMPHSVKTIPFRSLKKHSATALKHLNKWFAYNIDYPYPTARDKEKLAEKCGISIQQVANWFCNKRKFTDCSRLGRGDWIKLRRRLVQHAQGEGARKRRRSNKRLSKRRQRKRHSKRRRKKRRSKRRTARSYR